MVRTRPALRLVIALAGALSGVGCGGSGHSATPSKPGKPAARVLPAVPRSIPAPAPTRTPASPQAVAVIRGWSNALRAGHVQAAARYFQLPSELINGVGTAGTMALIRIHNLAQAEAANETLPCGAKLISTDQRGRYVNALFRLTGRSGPGGTSCGGSGPGQTARTNFVIAGGRIVEWIRAPDDPGDNGAPGSGGGGGGGGGGGSTSGATPAV